MSRISCDMSPRAGARHQTGTGGCHVVNAVIPPPLCRLEILRLQANEAVLKLSAETGLSVEATALYCLMRGIIEARVTRNE